MLIIITHIPHQTWKWNYALLENYHCWQTKLLCVTNNLIARRWMFTNCSWAREAPWLCNEAGGKALAGWSAHLTHTEQVHWCPIERPNPSLFSQGWLLKQPATSCSNFLQLKQEHQSSGLESLQSWCRGSSYISTGSFLPFPTCTNTPRVYMLSCLRTVLMFAVAKKGMARTWRSFYTSKPHFPGVGEEVPSRSGR